MASKPSAVDEVASSERRHWSDDRARIRLYSGAGLFVTLAVFAIWSYQHFFVVPPKLGPIGLDFLPFWGASYFVLHGHPLDAYNVDLMTSAQMAAQPWTAKLGGIMPWLYPPVMMILLAPVALLPVAGHFLWQIGTLREDGADPLVKFRSNRFAGLLMFLACLAVGSR